MTQTCERREKATEWGNVHAYERPRGTNARLTTYGTNTVMYEVAVTRLAER